MSTLSSSDPTLAVDGYSSQFPRIFVAATTFATSDVSSTGFWKGYGYGSRGNHSCNMQLGDILLHVMSSGSAKPGFVSMHSILAASANTASTVLSSGWNAAYDITVSACT